jgi:16S rRNA (cytosine967-C5)-methyltransferase
MTPAARLSAAIGVLDRVAAGEAAEKALTNWARGARYAGSKDRAAVRDIVFDILRMWRSCAALGGGDTGRARVLGYLRQTGQDPAEVFTGQGHAPAPLTQAEAQAGHAPQGAEALDLPDWLAARFAQSLGDQATTAALAMRSRAPVFLRVNLLKGDLPQARQALLEDGIETETVPQVPTALRVLSGARGVSRSAAYENGLVELQDASSQAVVERLPLASASTILDYCAGGGGKALAMAARTGRRILAHDADPRRMSDLPKRAARAGADVVTISDSSGPYDLVLCDVPCSGAGAFRRAPEGKWRLTPERLEELCRIQAQILDHATGLVRPGGTLAYVTCSVLAEENDDQARAFLARNPDWTLAESLHFLPGDAGDGFYLAILSGSGKPN